LAGRGFSVERQKPVPIEFDGMTISEGFRVDLLVEGALLIELKSVERIAPVHSKQVLTYLRLMKLPLGLLMNFGAATYREGVRRVVNNHTAFASSREPIIGQRRCCNRVSGRRMDHAKARRREGLVTEVGR